MYCRLSFGTLCGASPGTLIPLNIQVVRIGFDPTIYNVGEEDGSAVVTVRVLAGTLSSPVVVRLTTQDGSAGGLYGTHVITWQCGQLLLYTFVYLYV